MNKNNLYKIFEISSKNLCRINFFKFFLAFSIFFPLRPNFLRKILFILFFSFIFSSCQEKCIDWSWNYSSEVRRLENFSWIENYISWNIILEKSDSNFLKIEWDDNIFPLIETRIEKWVLIIENKNCVIKKNDISIKIWFKDLKSLKLFWKSSVRNEKILELWEFELNSFSDSQIFLKIDAKKTKFNLNSELSKVILMWDSDEIHINLDWNSSFDSFDTIANDVYIKQKSNLNANVRVYWKLDVEIFWNWNVNYKWNPKEILNLIEWNWNIVKY